MSVIATLGAVVKTAVAGIKTISHFLAAAAPAVGKAVTSGVVNLGAKYAVAKTIGTVAEIGTAYIISKGVDKLTDATIEKVPGVGPFIGFTLDVANDVNIVKGVWK